MTSDKGIALSRLLFLCVLFVAVAGLSLSFFISPLIAADSDSDGLSDAFENSFGTDPNSADCDMDGYSDWEEIFIPFKDFKPKSLKRAIKTSKLKTMAIVAATVVQL